MDIECTAKRIVSVQTISWLMGYILYKKGDIWLIDAGNLIHRIVHIDKRRLRVAVVAVAVNAISGVLGKSAEGSSNIQTQVMYSIANRLHKLILLPE